MAKKPLKRHSSLQPLSRDHHHSLLLCWKIRQGISKGVNINSIQSYCWWYYTQYVKEHFESEEKYLLKMLSTEHQNKIRKEHKELTALFESKVFDLTILNNLANLLEAHIRFEERVLFESIQNNTEEKLNELSSLIQDKIFVENSHDLFWL